MLTTFKFLSEKVYLPGYMVLGSEDYEKNNGFFDFNLAEPQVIKLPLGYLTPRGTDLCIVQAAYAFVENLVKEGKIDFDISKLRKIILEGRIKLIELNQKFRRDVGLSEKIQGKFTLTGFRLGRIPIAKFDFDLGNKAVSGDLVSVISPYKAIQINQDMLRG